jgi:hypothetical protein
VKKTMKYEVTIPFVIWAKVEVEAESESEAIETGLNDTALTTYCGCGGTDKLVGTFCHASIEVGDYFSDSRAGIKATAELKT